MSARATLRWRAWLRRALGVGSVSCALLSTGCDDASSSAVAELSGIAGTVERDYAVAPERWSVAALGARFHMGDGLRTGATSTARLELSPEGSALVERNTLVRFSADAPGEHAQHIVLEAGSLELSTDRFEVVVHTPRALTRIGNRSRAKLWSVDADVPARIELSVGRASVLRTGEQNATEVTPGGSLVLSEAPTSAAAAPSVAALPAEALDAVNLQADVDSPEANAIVAPLESTDVRVSVAEHAVVHAARLPVQIALTLPPCGNPSTLRVGAQRIVSTSGVAHVRLGQGAHTIDFRCGPTNTARGVLQVRRDEARGRVLGAPPEIAVAMDGRHYQVRHSGAPPAIRVNWPDAPTMGPYVLSVTSGGRTHEQHSDTPELTLGPRAVAIGPAELRFRSANGTVSRVTFVQVTFDETSHLMHWRSPRELASRSGAELVVQGTVLPGSRLRIADKPMTVSPNGDFRGVITSPAPGNALVAEVTHPLLGRHYYVRRLR